MLRRLIFSVLALVMGSALLAPSGAVAADAYPSRPVRIIVAFPPGGGTDIIARLVGQKLTELWGQQVVIDNRTGAGTIIGTEIVAQAAPDGYTVLMATPPLAVNPALYSKVPYDLERDFVAVTNVAASSNLLVVHPRVPAHSVKELIALLRDNPGRYNYG